MTFWAFMDAHFTGMFFLVILVTVTVADAIVAIMRRRP